VSDRIKVEGVGVRTDCPLPKAVHNPLNRPPISYKKPIIAFVVYMIVAICTLFISWIVFALWTAVYMVLIMKKAVIWMVHFYQNKAPDHVRLRCVFEPSCSEYAVLAIKKYGLVIGGVKTIGRLRRCHFPNGGKDYP
jgi:putative membrane protein insertion efficiency factor